MCVSFVLLLVGRLGRGGFKPLLLFLACRNVLVPCQRAHDLTTQDSENVTRAEIPRC